MFREYSFDTGVVTLNYVVGPPSGPPVVLLHGLSERWEVFLPILPILSLKWQVYAVDLRGHGKSGRVPGRYTRADYTEDIAAFLQQTITEPATVWGYCLGGMVACELAAVYPETVRAIIVGDMAITWEHIEQNIANDSNTHLYAAFQALASAERSTEELVGALAAIPVPVPGHSATVCYGEVPGVDSAFLRIKAEGLRHIDPDTLELHVQGRENEFLGGFEPPALLHLITCPVLLLQADPSRGGFMTAEDVALASSLLVGLTHKQFEKIGLWFGFERGKIEPIVLQTVLNFLDDV